MESGGVPASTDPAMLIKEVIHILSCGYEENTDWGKDSPRYFYRVQDAMQRMEVNILHAFEAFIQKPEVMVDMFDFLENVNTKRGYWKVLYGCFKDWRKLNRVTPLEDQMHQDIVEIDEIEMPPLDSPKTQEQPREIARAKKQADVELIWNDYKRMKFTHFPIPIGQVLAPDNHRSYFPGGPISRARSFMIFSSHHNIYNWGFPSLSLRLMPRLVAGTLAGGPPAATVSRDVSLCPTWKQRPHSAHYSRWSAVAVSRVVSPAGPSRPRLTVLSL
ncbi:hypothetical protein PIB30_024002 [Stylosanthes scabra]|uniref:Uncharacterized protein n=1 Tax=Stylosanthes scabra TaxID=79078 RepID=A0ABU6Z862_9FABA|nr:hypothetical protein [Stylosanthes scabra]